MQIDPTFVSELRALFKAGVTPSALICSIVERHPHEPQIDHLVRAYFREAFNIPMLRVVREHVEHIVNGGDAAWLNRNVLHQMVATRNEWDKPATGVEPQPTSWLDSLTATDPSALLRSAETQTPTAFGDSWGHIDEQNRRDICRTYASAQGLYERVQILAALAERLQQQLQAAEVAHARTE